MAETEIPNGKTWATNQHVIMAINIKSMNDFEQADGASPVFYGSEEPFTQSEPSMDDPRISIIGTKVKTYGGIINPATPVLLVTRVRDIENDKLTDLDKKYIVCSKIEIKDANTIAATITEKVYGDWNSLPNLTKRFMLKYKDIFDSGTKRRNDLIKGAKSKILEIYKGNADVKTEAEAEAKAKAKAEQEVARLKAEAEAEAKAKAEQEVARLKAEAEAEAKAKAKAEQEVARLKAEANKRAQNPAQKAKPTTKAVCNIIKDINDRKQCVADNMRIEAAEAKQRAKAEEEAALNQRKTKGHYQHDKEETQINKRKQKRTKGGTVKDDLTELIDIISNKDLNFKKYVYFVLMQPFYFKLNALTPRMLEQIKTYKLSGGGSTGTFETHILQPFVKFSYVKYIEIKEDLVTHLSSFIEHPEGSNIVSNFAGQIEKDTKNYNEITKSKDAGNYIHIFRFIELIEKTLEKYPPNDTQLPENVTNFIKYALENIHLHMMRVESLFGLLSSVDKILISNKEQTPKIEKPLQIYIDDYVSSQNRTDVITYLKITNTEPKELSDKSWNQRYDIRLKRSYMAGASTFKLNAMRLGYKSYPKPLYRQITDEAGVKHIAAVDGLQDIVTYKTPKVDYNEIDTIKQYDNYYMFGNYENIFPLYKTDGKKETNRENAAHMTAIIDQICTHNKPVFLLGYGASGSGKTSSLIYFNKGDTEDEKNGVVIHLCKEIIEKLNQQGNQVNKVKVVVKEFYNADKLTAQSSVEYEFEPDLTYAGHIDQPKHAYHVNMNKPVEEFKTMGEVLKRLVDVDRYVKATTNNPQSSRSHVLVFIQFYSKAPIRNLIIGDFAGKENVFQCADVDTIVSFLNTKIENPESNYPGYPFYSAQLRKGKTAGGGRTKGRINNYDVDPTTGSMHGPINLQPYLSNTLGKRTVYNFENSFESGHFNKNDSINEQEKYIKLAMKYQLEKMLKIKDNTNDIIYKRLLNIGEDEYSKLVPTNISIDDPIDIIDKYSLVKIKNDDTDNIAKMIENMCTDLLAKRKSWQKNARKPIQENLSREDVTLLSYYTNCYLTTCHVETEEKSNMLYQCIERFTGVKINDIPNTTNHICRMYGIILCTCYYMYVNSPAAVEVDATDPDSADAIKNYIEEINGIIAKYTARESKQEPSRLYDDVLSTSEAAILRINPNLKPPPQKNLKDEADAGPRYKLAAAIQIVTDMYTKVSDITGFEPFKYYQTDMTIIGETNRPGKITKINFGGFLNFSKVAKTDSLFDPISYDLDPTHKSHDTENLKFFPDKWGFPVLAGVENGHIELLKLIILEELFEVQSCKERAANFTPLKSGKELNRDVIYQAATKGSTDQSKNKTTATKLQGANENQMKNAIRSLNIISQADVNKNDINSYKFIDTEYSSILQRSKPTIKKNTDPSDYDMYFVSTINNMINFISKTPTNNDIFNTTYTTPFLCSQIADDVIAQLLTKFPNDDKTMVDGTKYSIVVTNPKKIPNYVDKFDNNREKPIPIVKTFTITGLSEHIMTTRFSFLFPFFEIMGGEYCKPPPKKKEETSCIHNYVNELKYILDSLHEGINSNNDMYNYLMYIKQSKYIIIQTMVRLKYGKQICENRVIEGTYINSTLDEIRAAFKYILDKKHKYSDALFHSPDFIDICLQSYCPSGINCFNTSSTDNAPKSLIDEIYNHIHPKAEAEATGETEAKFYKDIVISVFGVLNVSRLADNPPNVPYIDINHLKQIYYNKGNEYSQDYPILWALHELKKQIDDLNLKHSPSFYAGLKTLIESATDDYKEAPSTRVLTITRTSISKGFMANLKKMIEAIDIHNAASTIGTLEFLDQLSKFNSVNNLCYKNEGENKTPYLDDSEYKTYMTQNKWHESNIHK